MIEYCYHLAQFSAQKYIDLTRSENELHELWNQRHNFKERDCECTRATIALYLLRA